MQDPKNTQNLTQLQQALEVIRKNKQTDRARFYDAINADYESRGIPKGDRISSNEINKMFEENYLNAYNGVDPTISEDNAFKHISTQAIEQGKFKAPIEVAKKIGYDAYTPERAGKLNNLGRFGAEMLS